MRPRILGLVVFSCFMFSFGTVKADSYDSAVAVANAGYKEFLHTPLLDKNFCKEHHVTKKDLNGAITLGKPYQLYCMTPEHIRSYKTGMPVSQLAEKTNIFMFPVLFDGQAKLFLDVFKSDAGKFEIGSLGKSTLCKEIAAIQALYPSSDGFTLELIQNYQTHRYLVHMPQINQDNLTIIEMGKFAVRNYGQLASSSKSMERMKLLLEENMKGTSF